MKQTEERFNPQALIVRVKKDRGYVQVQNSTAQDGNLSFKARGLLVYLLSLPDDWRPRMGHLVANNPEGEHAVRSAFDELAKFGYAELVSVRGEDGRLYGTSWKVYETPQKHLTTDMAVFPASEKPSATNNTSPKGIQKKDSLYTPGSDEVLSEGNPDPIGKPEPSEEQAREEKPQPPEVEAYRKASGRPRVSGRMARLIAQTVKDPEMWQHTLETWVENGWKWDAVAVLDRYTNNIKSLNAAQRLTDRAAGGGRSRAEKWMTRAECDAHARKNGLTTGSDKHYDRKMGDDGKMRYRAKPGVKA